MAEEYAIAVDVGATRLRVCVGNREGKVLWRRAEKIAPPERVQEYVHSLVALVREAVGNVPQSGRVSGVGVASAGPLDLKKGVASPANLPYDSIPLVDPLRNALGLDVQLVNDANAAVLGEKKYGAGKGERNLVYVTISTGIGAGAIVDGHLLAGKDGNAAEVGHVVVDPAGRLACGCGRKGHWEAYCSGRNIPRFALLLSEGVARSQADASFRKLLRAGTLEERTPAILKAAPKDGPLGRRLVEELGRMNAMGFANIINMFDPSLITVGGGVALNNQELILGPVREQARTYALNRVPDIRVTPLGDDAGLLGALSLVFETPD